MIRHPELLLNKSDVWSNGNHWMSSASRDIFDDFYDSIAATFLNQFQTPEQIKALEELNALREWHIREIINISNSAQSRRRYDIKKFKLHRKPIDWSTPYEYKIIHTDFDDFFDNAPHGWCLDNGKETCLGLYDLFIRDFSLENIQRVFNYEKEERIKDLEEDLNTLYEYLEQDKYTKWFVFLRKRIFNEK